MILGSCSICGGMVEQPDVWFGVFPPTPTCRGCGATQKLPVIEMNEPIRTYTVTDYIWKDDKLAINKSKKE